MKCEIEQYIIDRLSEKKLWLKEQSCIEFKKLFPNSVNAKQRILAYFIDIADAFTLYLFCIHGIHHVYMIVNVIIRFFYEGQPYNI